MESGIPKRIENLEATLKVIIGLYEQNLDALKTELRLRKEGKVRGSTRQIDRVLADMQDVERRLRDYRKARNNEKDKD
jgi:hypothetical protein